MTFRHFNEWGWELMIFSLESDFVPPPATSFLADSAPSHDRGKGFIPRLRWRVHETRWVHERYPRARKFDAVVKYFEHRSGAANREILMDQGVGEDFTNGEWRKSRDVLPDGFANDLVGRKQGFYVTDETVKSVCITPGAHLFFERFDAPGPAILNDPSGFSGQVTKFGEPLGEEKRTEIRYVPASGS
jgi:hypothetical protein